MKKLFALVKALRSIGQFHHYHQPLFTGHLSDNRLLRPSSLPIILLLVSWLGLLFSTEVSRGQGALTNGWMHTGTITPVGDSDSWTFSANAGDSIIIKVGEMTTLSGAFSPRIRLNNPLGVQQATASDAVAAEIVVTATNTGSFTVIVDVAAGNASGTYRLTLAKTGDPIVVSPGDDGGPMTNGVAHQGSLPPGDLDLWNFTANTGDSIVIKMGQITDTNNFDPWIRLYGPDGRLLVSDPATAAAEVTFRATNSGTFLVVVGNDPYYNEAGNGTYLLTLAKTGDPIVVSPGDEGGPMTNGVAHQGSLPLGDLDLWNFTATSGDSIVIKMGQITETNSFDPWVRLYGPDGRLLASDPAAAAAEVTLRATNSGTFLVVVGNDPYYNEAGSGTYLLTLAKTGDPVVVSPGDDGGPMTNGVAHQGNLPLGDLDLWTFTASAGQAIVVRAGQISETNSFTPLVWLYGPGGTFLGSDFGASVAEVTTRATNSGVFLVVVDNSSYYNNAGSGTYLLTLAKTGDSVVTLPGDEGGFLNGTNVYDGTVTIGDLDVFTFTICAGEWIDVRADEVTQTNSFAPWVRLYGPSGLLLGSNFSATFGEVSRTATNGGAYTIVIGNSDYYNNAGWGAYRMTVNGLTSGLKLCPPVFVGTNANVSGIGGVTNATYILFTHTNLVTPFAQWTPLATNQFDQFGVFTRTNVSGRYEAVRFFRLLEPLEN